MAQYDLGTAHGRIELDASSLGRASASLKFVADRMLIVGAAAAAGFGYAVKSAAEFETQISRFKAVSDSTEKDMEKVRAAALKLGVDAGIGAREVAEGFVEIAKAGYGVEDLIAGMGKAAVQLAAAGEIEMAAATDVLVVALKAFKLPASDAVRVVDLLAGAANASLADVDDLAESFKYAAPVAATLGVSIEDLTAMLAIFGNVGIKASSAGTSMRSIFLGLAAETPKAAKVMKELNIITEDGTNRLYDQNGALKPLAEVWGILGDALKDVSPKQRVTALNAIFQRRALAAAAEAAIQGKNGFEFMRKEQEKTTAAEVMREKLDNLEGSAKKLKAAVENAAISIGTHFQEPLQKAAEWIQKLVEKFNALPDPIQKATGWAILAFASFLLLGGVMFKVGQYTIMAYRAFKDLGEALAIFRAQSAATGAAGLTAFGWVFVVVVALALLLGTAYLVWKNWDKIWKWIEEHPAYAAIILVLLSILNPLIFFGVILGALAKNWRQIWDKIKEWSSEASDKIVAAFNKVIEWFKTDFLNFFKVTLPNFFASLPGKFAKWGKDAADAFVRFMEALPNRVAFALGFVIGKVIQFGLELIPAMINAAAESVRLFGEIMGGLIPWAIQFGLDMITKMMEWILSMAEQMPGWLIEAVLKLQQWGAEMTQSMIDIGWNIIRETGNWAMNVGPEIMLYLSKLPWEFALKGWEMLRSFVNGLNSAFGGDVLPWMGRFTEKLLNSVSNLVGGFWDAGIDIMRGLWEGLKSLADKVADWVGDFAKRMVDKITNPLGIWSPSRVMMAVGKDFMKGLQIGLEKNATGALSPLSKLSNDMIRSMDGVSPTLALAGAGSGGGDFNVKAEINIHGVSDPTQARAAGESAAKGFSDALSRRQLQTTARTF